VTRPAESLRAEIVVIGSGAGGAVTAAHLAERGRDVLVLEEGPDIDTATVDSHSTEAFRRLYRHGGMTPILGPRSIGFVEGRCVGGSTEINSGFWQRLPPDSYYRWAVDALVDEFSPAVMEPRFERIESLLSVSLWGGAPPPTSEVLRRGAEVLQWRCVEVPRSQKPGASASPFAPGAKQSMQRTLLPLARSHGARLLADCRVTKLAIERGRVRAVKAVIAGAGPDAGPPRAVRIEAETVFVCGGAIQTPALLRRSGVRQNVGNNLCIHPMLKAAALFDDPTGATDGALPLYQVKEFSPNVTLGGSVFTPGFLATSLAADWSRHAGLMADWSRMALYYAAVRGMKRGRVRVLPFLRDGVVARYPLSLADRKNLTLGLTRLCQVLFAGGARAVVPAVRGAPVLRSFAEAEGWMHAPLPAADLDLTTVHVFSTCPMGENPDLCATDSFGRVTGFENLHVNDASLIPDSPGVNPQATTMAIALRNVEHFLQAAPDRRAS
jgi:choline dehydrogenase-like flavoprotein